MSARISHRSSRFSKGVSLACAVVAFPCLLTIFLIVSSDVLIVTRHGRLFEWFGQKTIAAMGIAASTVAAWVSARCVYMALRWQVNHRREDEVTRCRNCGYNLTGNVSGVCPECGEEACNAPVCLRCGYNLMGNTSGVCPECGNGTSASVICPDARDRMQEEKLRQITDGIREEFKEQISAAQSRADRVALKAKMRAEIERATNEFLVDRKRDSPYNL